MAQFLVKWEIDIEADDFETAAKEALEIQRDIFSEATCFTVIRQSDKKELDFDLDIPD